MATNKLLPPSPNQAPGIEHDQSMNVYLWGNGIVAELADLRAQLASLKTAAAAQTAAPKPTTTGFTGKVTIATTTSFVVVEGVIQSVT